MVNIGFNSYLYLIRIHSLSSFVHKMKLSKEEKKNGENNRIEENPIQTINHNQII